MEQGAPVSLVCEAQVVVLASKNKGIQSSSRAAHPVHNLTSNTG
jgi:hypothetical protein